VFTRRWRHSGLWRICGALFLGPRHALGHPVLRYVEFEASKPSAMPRRLCAWPAEVEVQTTLHVIRLDRTARAQPQV
jgi:hypothetical protein